MVFALLVAVMIVVILAFFWYARSPRNIEHIKFTELATDIERNGSATD